jgi:hypothetical protein
LSLSNSVPVSGAVLCCNAEMLAELQASLFIPFTQLLNDGHSVWCTVCNVKTVSLLQAHCVSVAALSGWELLVLPWNCQPVTQLCAIVLFVIYRFLCSSYCCMFILREKCFIIIIISGGGSNNNNNTVGLQSACRMCCIKMTDASVNCVSSRCTSWHSFITLNSAICDDKRLSNLLQNHHHKGQYPEQINPAGNLLVNVSKIHFNIILLLCLDRSLWFSCWY